MLSRALNENNDIYAEKGACVFLSDSNGQGIDRVMQSIRTRLNFYQGEWFLDESAGVPWRQQIFVKPANLAIVESIIKAKISSTYGVNELQAFAMSFDPQNRTLNIAFSCNTIYGNLLDKVTLNG